MQYVVADPAEYAETLWCVQIYADLRKSTQLRESISKNFQKIWPILRHFKKDGR